MQSRIPTHLRKYFFYSSNASLFWGLHSMWWLWQKSPSFAVLTFLHCMVKVTPVNSLPPVVIYSISPLHWWHPSCMLPFNFTHVQSLTNLFSFTFIPCPKHTSVYHILPIQTLHNLFPLLLHTGQNSNTHFRCSRHPS